MEDVCLVASQGPKVDVGVVDQQLDALDVVVQYCVVQSSEALFTFEVYEVGVAHLFQDVLDVEEASLLTGEH